MKIALCFSGQPRFINESSEGILKNVIGNKDVDVFAHLWFDDSLKTQPYKYGGDGGWVNQRISETAIDDFKRIYNPVSVKVEPSKKFRDKNLIDNYMNSRERYKKGSINNPLEPDFSRRDINNIISYYYSLNQVNILRKEYEYERDFKYDVIVKLRTDVIIRNALDLEFINPNKIYYSEMGQPDGMISDWLNYGDSKSMSAFMGGFPLLDYLIEDSMKKTGGAWCCEMLHRMIMDRFEIEPNPVNLGIGLHRF
jgi:hypothetical protein